MKYAISIQSCSGQYAGTFPDFPETLITATSAAELEKNAYDHLISVLMGYMEKGMPVPVPKAEPNPTSIDLLPSIDVKVQLHNLALSQYKNRSWIASEMGVTRQVMTRLFNLRETTKVETLNNALNALGYEMSISIAPKANKIAF